MWKWETEHDAKGVIIIVHNMLEHTGRYAYVITMLRRNGYHVIMGDLPGQGQTSRANRGQLQRFEIYHEQLVEWIKIANEYKLPTFVMGVGLGGLIILNLLEKTELPIEGILLLSPMLEFKKNYKTRKNMFISNIGKSSKGTQFKLGIDYEDLTRNSEVINETNHDGLMLKKVSYKWFNIINETMKDTSQHIKDIKPLPTLLMYGTEDKILETSSIDILKQQFLADEFYFKAWKGFYHEIQNEPERDQVMRYILTFLNNSVNTMGFIVQEEDIEEV